MARAPARSPLDFFGGGGRVPPIIGVLIAATLAASLVGAIGGRHGVPLVEWCALVPGLLSHGQLWRVFSWVFLEIEPFGLIFAALSLYWFGRDLAARWGPGRFVLVYLGYATLVAGVLYVVSLVYPPLRGQIYVGAAPMQDALIILWASFYPTRQILAMFVLPLSGRRLIWLTIGLTALFACYYGLDAMAPHITAELLALAMVALPSPRAWWIEAKLRGLEKKRRGSHLKAVPREPMRGGEPSRDHDDDRPPGGRWLN